MQTYLIQARYTSHAISNLVAKPEDRAKVVSRACEEIGGKLISLYMSFGEYDIAAIAEMPNDEAAAAMALGTTSHGHVSDFKTTRLFTSSEILSALKHAAKARDAMAPPKGK
jgi:uncharacterized protein with GYD domain